MFLASATIQGLLHITFHTWFVYYTNQATQFYAPPMLLQCYTSRFQVLVMNIVKQTSFLQYSIAWQQSVVCFIFRSISVFKRKVPLRFYSLFCHIISIYTLPRDCRCTRLVQQMTISKPLLTTTRSCTTSSQFNHVKDL